MGYNSTDDFLKILDELAITEAEDGCSLPPNLINRLMGYIKSIYRSDMDNKYSKPMLYIGMYIAAASLVCILAMVADLLHGLRSRKLWFPCRHFKINSFFITMISIAMKLLVDLSGSMPGDVDQVAKIGSMAFMCTMMANLLPCFATMDSDDLLSNITALGVLVITLVVNVIIQIQTGVVSYNEDDRILLYVAPKYNVKSLGLRKHRNTILAWIYVALLLVLLMVLVCSCLAILKSKKIIASKYQERRERAATDIHVSSKELPIVKKLRKQVINHWIMAGSGSPQFIIACFCTTSASGVISVLVTILHTLTMSWTIKAIREKSYDSDYGKSMIVILAVQSIGVVIGTIAPISRCFATLSFKVSSDIISKHFKVLKVESYWTGMLNDWKRASIKLPFHSRPKLEVVKRLILRICMEIQEEVVVLCKIVSLVPFVLMVCGVYCLKRLWKAVFSTSRENTAENRERTKEIRSYVLQLEDEMELGERTLEGLSKSAERFIKKGKKRRPEDLEKLIKDSNSGFEGVKKFDDIDHRHVPSLRSKVQDQDFWSLPVVTLTIIAISLLEKENDKVKSLLRSVWEGLRYVTRVEESLNFTNENECLQKQADTLWQEILYDQKWLGVDVPDHSFKEKTAKQVVEWFRDTAKNKDTSEGAGIDDDPIHRSICANSMYHITKTILYTYKDDDTVSQENLFDSLRKMIADIIAACLTNLPQVITKKCHSSAIEKWEDRVKDAALLLGETKEIIEILYNEDRGNIIPGMDRSDLPYISKWRAHLRNP